MQLLLIYRQKQREWADDCYRTSVNVIFTQISAKQGINIFNKRAMATIVKEYKQLNNMNTLGRVCPEDLTTKHR